MKLINFVSSEPRPLPIFVLADTSGSMRGEKINELNMALKDMIETLKNVDDIRGKFQVCIITFGGSIEILQPLEDVEKIKLQELTANGRTPMGEALRIFASMVEDKQIVGERAYTPTAVLISDALATDREPGITNYLNWEPLKLIHSGSRAAKCQRLAMGIGNDADVDMLKAFVNNPEIPIIKAKNAKGISTFIKWVTMSSISRMNSINPNLIPIPEQIGLDDDEILL